MTVKLAKLFGGVEVLDSANNQQHQEQMQHQQHQQHQQQQQQPLAATTQQHLQQPPPLPPPNANMKSLKYYEHLQATYDCHDLMDHDHDHDQDQDDYEDTCMQRNHPYNNSQRPLLGDRRPQLTVMSVGKKGKSGISQQNLPLPLPPLPPLRSYISPYVQQQKRDSAKGLHGFNDFDALSQQYNQHLQSPHIGYPYGSPPSPTAQSSDFCFDRQTGLVMLPGTTGQLISSSSSNCSSSHTTSTSSPTRYYPADHPVSSSLYPSRFEDDFCMRRPPVVPDGSSPDCRIAGEGGPFIFGIAPEQQATDYGSNPLPPTPPQLKQQSVISRSPLQQSLSDTSAASSGKGTKFLLRKRKSKKTTAATAAATTVATAEAATTAKKDGKKGITPSQPSIKCVLVGDGAVGKTNLILSYLENRFNPEHIPTASDIYNADVNVNESPVHLTLCDTAGQDTLDPLRELCYPDSDVFLLCFSVVKPESFRAIKAKWAPKFAKTKAALILVGTQADLRTSPNVLNKLQTNGEKAISYADAWDLATTIGAKYIETSSATQDKVKDVFDTAIWEGLVPTTLPPTPSFWRKLFCLA
ncbi:uncharacterized protein LOC108097496 [Drosophila ficusphila]|uniref:uncharacterized protein LOC108097496 n=1 Tax=Drosophila ficusphila TaxID=30025 RepID=UPI0007E6E285|nr:uncharacterized protein LOC108097496 [Drosophila ficusphila]XP_017055292.1 uncharacterized protein LOC108097496 [Drosophila ficusphila]XP_017055293.1 uncharacterized protein LOC108097496 [Drosophila ficusphila]XP_017055294.1 uncharacterized protein LOC108097496 [Drosophila ficusphila]